MTNQVHLLSLLIRVPETHRTIEQSKGKEILDGRKHTPDSFLVKSDAPVIKNATYTHCRRPHDGKMFPGGRKGKKASAPEGKCLVASPNAFYSAKLRHRSRINDPNVIAS
jgi:hypothetical protein